MGIKIFVKEIKKKKSLSKIDDSFIEELVNNYLKKHEKIKNILIKHPKPKKSKEFKLLLKNVRKELHDIYGVFDLSNKREKLLNELERYLDNSKRIDDKALEIHRKILLTHRSTKERLSDYEFIYKNIFRYITPKSILDLSCGLNPISYPFMNLDKLMYIATELTVEDCNFIKHYFRIMKKHSNLNGKVIKLNLLDAKKFPKADVCFLFKVLDSLERLKRNISKDLLDNINSKFIIVSFPTKTLSGKILSKKRLAWFNRIIKNYNTFETKNEIFYIINKTKHY